MQEFYNDFLFYRLVNEKRKNILQIDTQNCNSITIINTSLVGFITVNDVTLSPNEIIKFVGKENEILLNQKIYIRWNVGLLINNSVTIIRKNYTNNVTKLQS